MVERVWGCQDDHGTAGPVDSPLPHLETGNESYRFRHSTHEAKGRIKAREQARKAAAKEVNASD